MADETKDERPAPKPGAPEPRPAPPPSTPVAAGPPTTPAEQKETTLKATAEAGKPQPAISPPAPTTAPTPAKPAPAKAPPAPRPKTLTPDMQTLLAPLGERAQHLEDTDPNIPTVLIRKEDLVAVLGRLKHELGYQHLACITAVDVKENFEVIYNLWSYTKNLPFEVKVRLPRDNPVLPSVCGLWIGANWLEREEYDLMGIRFEGHPDLRRIFLPEGWQGHPLRKDYDLKHEQYVALDDSGEDVVFQEPREGAW